MKKTSPYIDPEVDRAFAWRAATEGVSKAKLVRRVLAAEVAERPRPKARGGRDGGADDGGGVVGDGTTCAHRPDVKKVGEPWFDKDTS